jgi:hypothetical protein
MMIGLIVGIEDDKRPKAQCGQNAEKDGEGDDVHGCSVGVWKNFTGAGTSGSSGGTGALCFEHLHALQFPHAVGSFGAGDWSFCMFIRSFRHKRAIGSPPVAEDSPSLGVPLRTCSDA